MNIDDRMKRYEAATRYQLTPRSPVVIRLDGKAFHTLTKDARRPYDTSIRDAMVYGAKMLLSEIPARFAYQQSDEVSLLLVDYNKFESQQWFDGIIQKMASVSASIMGVEFTTALGGVKHGYFDARVFEIPERDIENHFVWRQQDAMRNAVSMAAQAYFSSKELHGKHTGEMLEMLSVKGIKFDEMPAWFRFGTIVTRDRSPEGVKAEAAPVFTQDKTFLKKFLTVEEE